VILIFLVAIVWSDGSGRLNPCPTYGTELNSLFLDIINDIGFEQFVTSPTQNSHVLDLVLSTHSTIINLNIVPGMSDHKATTFHVGSYILIIAYPG